MPVRRAARILVLLTATLGLPYVVLAATAPLIQDWFARSGPGRAPYRLYALSNLGSLLALLAYPARRRALPVASRAVACMVGAVRRFLRRLRTVRGADDPIRHRRAATARLPALARTPAARRFPRGDIAMWLLLSACGSGLLLAATNQLCQNIAVVPLLWIVPLTCYLLTFIVCFAGCYRRSMWAPLLLAAVGGAAWSPALRPRPRSPGPRRLAGALVAGCMVCHGELVRIRPAASRLTSFYLAIAAGGSLGG